MEKNNSSSNCGGDRRYHENYRCSWSVPARLLLGIIAQLIKNPPAVWETWVLSWGGKIPWRRAWQPTPVFLPGKSHGQRSLAGYSPWGHKESDTTE